MEFLFIQIVNLVLIYSYPVIGLAVLVSSIGLPLPQTSIILTAGSLAAVGDMNFGVLFVLVTVCSIAGDLIDYILGRKIGELLVNRFKHHSKREEHILLSAQRSFTKWSGLSIFFTRWLFTPLATPVSLLAGFTKYSIKKFLFFDITGQLVSSIVYLSIGYYFSAKLLTIWNYFESVPGILTLIAIGLFLLFFGLRKIYKTRRRREK